MFDFITIGSATLDVFVESKDANIVSVTSLNRKTEFMSFPYGSKLEIDNFSFAVGGGAVNSAINFVNLGFSTSTIVKLGKDFQSKTILKKIDSKNVDTSNIIKSSDEISGFSIILLSFQGDRTVLAHRGTNATISEDQINFEAIKDSKWLYIAPLSGESAKVLDKISSFAEEQGINMAINLGTTSIKKDKKALNKVIKTAEVLIMNLEEASMLTEIQVRPDSSQVKYSSELIHEDIKRMLKYLSDMKAKIVIITDGKNGVYAYDGNTYYRCSQFPAKVQSTLGAGDAFASTFVGSLVKTSGDIIKSLKYASVNAASVVQEFGASNGLLTFPEMEEKLEANPDFQVQLVK